MKIGLFTDTYYPELNGVAISVLMLKENLEKMGHRVYVFTTTCPNAPAGERDVFRVPSIAFKVRRLGSFINPHLRNVIRQLELDLIHTHTEFSLGIFGRSVARALNLPLVHTMHTIYEDYTGYVVRFNGFTPIAKKAARLLTASFCNTSAITVVPTEKVHTLIASYGVTRDIKVIPTGLELAKFDAAHRDPGQIGRIRESLGILPDDRVLVNVGRISKEKNLSEILRAMRQFLPARPQTKLLLVGDGPGKEDAEALVRALGLERQVIFAGARPWSEIGLYYGAGDVFVCASQSETQGLTYVEAMASSLPVVAKRDPCLDGLLQDGINGYAFSDEAELLAALARVLDNEAARLEMAQNAERTARRYSAEAFAENLTAVYREALSNHVPFRHAS